MRARIGTPLSAAQREARVEQHGRNRDGNVHRERLAGQLRAARARPRAPLRCAGRDSRLRQRLRTAARRADRRSCATDGRSRESRAARARYSPTTSFAAAFERPPLRRASRLRAADCPAFCDAPRITEPQPRIPAATAPCSASGAAASVMRLACTLGTSPCSAIATSVASSTRRCASFGMLPVTSSQT